MEISIDERWEGFIQRLVQDGRYGSASDVICEGLRLLKERDAKLAELRESIHSAIAEGGGFTSEEITADLDELERELRAKGY